MMVTWKKSDAEIKACEGEKEESTPVHPLKLIQANIGIRVTESLKFLWKKINSKVVITCMIFLWNI